MNKTIYSKKIAESLSSGNHPKEFATLFVALLRQLAMGGPVSREKLAGALGWSGARVATVLEQAPGTEYDDEANIIGLGLTLRETSHVFEVDGRHLYTWCALDTLMFPALTGKIARVTSRCAATGRPITLTVAPEAVLHVEPAEAMVSLRTPDTSPDIRCSFCCHVHFFASPSIANSWASTHQGIEVVPVESAFELGHDVSFSRGQSSGNPRGHRKLPDGLRGGKIGAPDGFGLPFLCGNGRHHARLHLLGSNRLQGGTLRYAYVVNIERHLQLGSWGLRP